MGRPPRGQQLTRGIETRRITAAGRDTLRAWLDTPARATALECEPLLRVLLGDLAGAEAMRAALAQVRADAEAILSVGRRVSAEYLAGTAPFKDQVHLRVFVFDFLSHHALMLHDWADRTEATLDQWPRLTGLQREHTALAAIARVRAAYRDQAGA